MSRWLKAATVATASIVLGGAVAYAGTQLAQDTGAPEPPGSPSPELVGVLQYNARGVLRHTGGGGDDIDPDWFRFMRVLAGRVVDLQPQVVTLNEICLSQVRYLIDELADKSYEMSDIFFTDGEDDRCSHPDAGYGMRDAGRAILTRGPASEIATPMRRLGEDEPFRGCVLWQEIRVCGLHIHGAEVPSFGEALVRWNGKPLIVSGDLNIHHDDFGLEVFYKHFHEVDADDLEPTICVGECNKIDYIFADTFHFAPETDGQVERLDTACGGKACSDHYLLFGAFRRLAVDAEPPPTSLPTPDDRDEPDCTVPNDDEILRYLQEEASASDADEQEIYLEVLEKECVEEYLIVKALSEFRDRLHGNVFLQRYECYLTRTGCLAGAVTGWTPFDDPPDTCDPEVWNVPPAAVATFCRMVLG